MLGLAFSGGGARGAFQVGVWKALHEMGWESRFSMAAGASVGAVNAALFAQGDFALAYERWTEGGPHLLFDCLADRQEVGQDLSWGDYLALAKDGFNHGGIRVNPLKNLLRATLDETSIRSAPIDFGLVAYNKTLRRGEYWQTRTIPPGALTELVIASATFPLFQAHAYNGFSYLDGGLQDLIPFDFVLRQPGIERVIAVDVSVGTRLIRRYRLLRQRFGDRIITIRPSRMLPSPLNFSRQVILKQIELGFTDGLKRLAFVV